MANSTLFLIPNLLSSTSTTPAPPACRQALLQCDWIFAESPKGGRALFLTLGMQRHINRMNWETLPQRPQEFPRLYRILDTLKQSGQNAGLISDAGCPAVGDPGEQCVQYAHKVGISIKPIAGPNAVIMALMSSGLNGQRFVFHGYTPRDKSARATFIRKIEKQSRAQQQTQIFIETPYRNAHLLASILQHCNANTLLSISQDISGAHEFVRTQTIQNWRAENHTLSTKLPATFLLLAQE